MKTLITCLSLTLCMSVFGQGNILHNPGFETDDGGFPTDQAQVDKLAVWEQDYNGPDYCGASPYYHHSPDWYQTNGNYKMFNFTNSNFITARTGYGYVGMSQGELIQQQTYINNPLLNGKEYEVSSYFQFPGDCHSWLVGSVIPNVSQDPGIHTVRIKVFIATNKIKYRANHDCDEIGTWPYSGDFCEKKDGIFNDIVNVANFDVTTANFTSGLWHRLASTFVVPNDNKNYEWVAFEVSCAGTTSEKSKNYIVLDDMKLIRACELGCSNVSNGPPNPTIGSYPPGGPKCMGAVISNIQNVETIKVEAFALSGGAALRTHQFTNNNGFSGPVYWDGCTANGAAVSAGNYLIKLTCTNACGQFIISGNVFNPGCASIPYPEVNPPPLVNNTDIQIFDCCELVTHVNNKVFGPTGPPFSPSLWHYRPRNELYINTCTVLANTAETELIAGQLISITGETQISPNTNKFHAWIDLCADAHRFANPALNEPGVISDGLNESSRPSSKTQEGDKDIRIVPNPSSDGKFQLVNVANTADLGVKIIDGKGITVKEIFNSTTIDISNLDRGVYIVEVYSGGKTAFRKLIYL